jgi:hypothetical protein
MIETINKYEQLKNNIAYYIDISGYKNSYLAEQLGMGTVSFSRRKSTSSFTFEQIKKLSQFIFAQEYVEKTQLLDQVLQKSMEQSRQGKTTPNKQVIRTVNA